VEKNERYELDSDDSEDAELLLDSLEADDSELALDSLDADDSELALDSLEDEESGPVGLPLLQPPSAPTPARAAPPDSRIRNSRRSERRSLPASEPSEGFFFSLMTTPALSDWGPMERHAPARVVVRSYPSLLRTTSKTAARP
jgi:hypothetical protein